MVSKAKKTSKRLEGVGPLFKGVTEIAKVWYVLPIPHEFYETNSSEDTEEVFDLLDILGEFSVVEGDPLIEDGDHLTLHLKEGPRIEIEVVDYEFDQGFFQLPEKMVDDFLVSIGLKA
jgi:hypothetical protein